MKKLKMARGVTLTFEKGCNKYLENCRQRNLRQGTINHYKQCFGYASPSKPLFLFDFELRHMQLPIRITYCQAAILSTVTTVSPFSVL